MTNGDAEKILYDIMKRIRKLFPLIDFIGSTSYRCCLEIAKKSYLVTLYIFILSHSVFAFTLEDINQLRLRSPLPASGSYSGFAARGTTVVGATQSGEIVVSQDDGETWQAQPPYEHGDLDGRFEFFSDVVSSPSSFIIFSQSRRYIRTEDFVTFTQLEFPGSFSGANAAYGNGVHVVVDFNNRSYRSTDDGLTWVLGSLPDEISRLEDLSYGGGRFVAVDIDTIVSSVDGVSWTRHPVSQNDDETFESVSYSNGNFFVIGRGGLVYTSPNGTNWTRRVSGFEENLSGFVAVEEDGSYYIYADFVGVFQLSANFSSINEVELERGFFSIGVQTDSGAVVGGRLFGDLFRRAAGASVVDDPREFLTESFGNVVFGAGRFVMSDPSNGFIFTTTDGVNFTFAFQVPNSGRIQTNILYGNGVFQFFSNDGMTYTSADGINWQEQEVDFSARQVSEFINGQFVVYAFYQGDELFLTSSDGVNWTPLNVPDLPNDPTSLAFGEGLYVAGSFENQIYTSPDLVTWTARSVPNVMDGDSFRTIGYGGGRFMAFGSDNALSEDGVTWTLLTNRSFTSPTRSRQVYEEGIGFFGSSQSRLTVFSDDSTVDDAFVDSPFFPGGTTIESIAEGNGIVVATGSSGSLYSTSVGSPEYEFWSEQNFDPQTPLALRVPLADADGDGQTNLQEYAVGTDPEVPNPDIVLEVEDSSFGPEVTFEQRADLDDVQALIEVSFDMDIWSSQGVLHSDRQIGGGREAVTGRLTNVSGDEPKRFLRVRWSFTAP